MSDSEQLDLVVFECHKCGWHYERLCSGDDILQRLQQLCPQCSGSLTLRSAVDYVSQCKTPPTSNNERTGTLAESNEPVAPVITETGSPKEESLFIAGTTVRPEAFVVAALVSLLSVSLVVVLVAAMSNGTAGKQTPASTVQLSEESDGGKEVPKHDTQDAVSLGSAEFEARWAVKTCLKHPNDATFPKKISGEMVGKDVCYFRSTVTAKNGYGGEHILNWAAIVVRGKIAYVSLNSEVALVHEGEVPGGDLQAFIVKTFEKQNGRHSILATCFHGEAVAVAYWKAIHALTDKYRGRN